MRAVRTLSVPDPIASFTGAYRFLSNFAVTPTNYPQLGLCLTAEHAFQANKTLSSDEQARVRAAETPGDAKRLGRRVPLRDDWEAVKIPIMREVLAHKFVPKTQWADMLVATEGCLLIEGNTWGDTFWGAVSSRGQWRGENWLGWLLMAQRAYIIGSGN